MTAVSAHALRKTFGSVVALDNIGLEIRRGEFYGLLGPNGAGKTTFLRIVSGLLKADGGELRILDNVPPADRSSVLGVVPQEIALYDVLTAKSNLEIFGSLTGLSGATLAERIHAVLDQVGLSDRVNAKVKTFSGGMKRRLNLAAGLLADPPILLLDEPTVGVDPQSRSRIFELLRELHSRGKTIIYTTHYMEEAERLCERIGIIDHGKLLAEGTLRELLGMVKLPRVVRVHLPVADHLPVVDGAELVRDSSYVDYIPRREDQLAAVVAELQRSGLQYERLEITGPNLEALFLQLTGKELRD